METKEVSRNWEPRKEEMMGSFTFHTGTLCGLQPLLLSSGESLQKKDSTNIPAQVTQDSKYKKLDTHMRFGVSMWHYASPGPDQTNLVRWFKPWETGPRSVDDEEFSWSTGYLPRTSMDQEFQEETRSQLQEAVNVIQEIQETGGRVPSVKMIIKLANQRWASRSPKQSPRSKLHSRRRLVFDS